MVSLEDPCSVAKDLIDANWSTDTGGVKPGLRLRRESNVMDPTPDVGDIWFYEQTDETETVDIFHNYEDTRWLFGVQARANDYDRLAVIWAEIERIRRLKVSDPGSDLASPDTTFNLWLKRGSSVGWEGKGNFNRTLNYEMVEYHLQIRS